MSLLTISQRQKLLLKSLLHSQGKTVDELSKILAISRNAVKQHLASLEGNGFIESTKMSSTGGRPSKIYTLTTEGKELFPRHYALFSNSLILLLKEKVGEASLEDYMIELGTRLANDYQKRLSNKIKFDEKVAELTNILLELGYEAETTINSDGMHEIIASNCVFHKLAEENNAVCKLDIALISTLLETENINHCECMAKGGSCCRFILK